MEVRTMRPSKFTEAQIVQALRQVENGMPAVEMCRKLAITETTFYRWRRKYGGEGTNDAQEMQELRDENKTLKEIVANLLLDNQRSANARERK
jgi:putative transposase